MNTRPAAPAPRLIDMGMRKLYALDPRAAFAAGAPEVFDEVTVDGRFGIVLRRLDGPTLQQLLLTSAMTPEQVGAILASLYTSVHKTPPPDVPSLRRWIDFASQASRDILPQRIATGAGAAGIAITSTRANFGTYQRL
jgi:hypothetical protein